jgi:hypothetical protein
MSDMEETEGTESPAAPHRVIGTPPPSPRLLGSAAVPEEPGAVALVSDSEEFAEHIDGLPPDDPKVIVHGRRAERVVAACFIIAFIAGAASSPPTSGSGSIRSTRPCGPTWRWDSRCPSRSWPSAWAR